MNNGRALTALLFVLLSSRAVTLFAQQDDLVFKHLSIEQGLSQSIVDAMVQDRGGFMWFVTEDGLNRYDGYEFKVFKHDARNPASLTHNEIKCIAQDRTGILWVGTFYRGLERFDPATETFRHFQHDPANPASLSNDIVWAVMEDRNWSLWVGTGGGGLDRLDQSTGTFTHFRHDPHDPASLSNDDVRALYEDKGGHLWVGTAGGGLNRFDPASGKFTHWVHDPKNSRSLSSNDVRAILQDADGAMWVGTFGGGLNRLDPATGMITRFLNSPGDPKSLSNDNVLALLLDATQRLWVGTDGGGLNLYVRDQGNFVRHQNSPNVPTSIAGNRIYSLYLDRSGILWVGTYGNGLSRCDLAKKQFLHYRNDPEDPNSLSHNIVWTFCERPPGTLWVGTNDGGLNRLDRATGRVTRYMHDPKNPASLSHNSVRMVAADQTGTLWVATNGGGLDRLDPKTGVFEHFRHDEKYPGSLSLDELRMVFEDSRGTIWVGTYGGGLDRFDPNTGRFAHYRYSMADPKSISGDYVRTAFEDKSGALWFGTHGAGLNRFDRATGDFTRYRNDPKNPSTLTNDFVFCIHEDRAGRLWVATYGGGLNLLDREKGTFTAFRKENGLPDDAIYGILEDAAGDAVAEHQLRSREVRPRDAEGPELHRGRRPPEQRVQRGRLLPERPRGDVLRGHQRLYRLRSVRASKTIRTGPRWPSPTSSSRAARSPWVPCPTAAPFSTRAISETTRMDLTYRDKVLSFEFASMDFASPDKNRYAYILEGLDKDWTELGTRRSLMFTTLPPGRYTLRIKGTNSDGVWNESGASIRLSVRPPWWRAIWAYIAYAFLLTGAVYLIVLFERNREREKGELVEAELRAQAAEFQSRTVEAESRALKLENERKTHELEGARKLQLSMLPNRLPDYPGYAIAARMLTATEVGGDYYDFRVGEDGTLAVAIGDATGHGTRAGIFVAAMKTLFAGTPVGDDLQSLLRGFNRTLHALGRDQIYMALGLLRVDGPEVKAISAAVPPLLVWRSASGEVELVTLCGMFLGTDFEIPYGEARLSLGRGDKILLLSDGYLEQLGPSGERLEESRATDYLKEAAGLSPEALMDHMLQRLEAWRGAIPQGDDVTLVLLEYPG